METLTLPATFDNYQQARNMKISHQGITEPVFEEVYKTYFKALHAYANSILNDSENAEEMVQQMFLKLWEKKETIAINSSIQAYLYRSVYHEALNFLRHQKVKQVHSSHVMHTSHEASNNHQKDIQSRELENKIREALNKLPEQCRTIFQLSRFEELKYKEIADRLQLSIKTVENQMGKALKIMRAELVAYLPTLWIVLIVAITNFINY